MRRSTSLLLARLAVLVSNPVLAFNHVVLEAVCGSGSGITLEVSGEIDLSAYPTLVGFDLYRQPIRLISGDEVRVTPDPIPFAGGEVSLSFQDLGAQSHLLYEYRAVGVDVDRNPIATNLYWNYDWTSCGDAPLGLIRAEFVNGRYVPGPACGDCCSIPGILGFTYELPATLQNLIDAGWPYPILVYGTMISFQAQMHGPATIVNSWVHSDCGLVGVEPTAWSHVKQIYR